MVFSVLRSCVSSENSAPLFDVRASLGSLLSAALRPCNASNENEKMKRIVGVSSAEKLFLRI